MCSLGGKIKINDKNSYLINMLSVRTVLLLTGSPTIFKTFGIPR